MSGVPLIRCYGGVCYCVSYCFLKCILLENTSKQYIFLNIFFNISILNDLKI